MTKTASLHHPWNLSPPEAVLLQSLLKKKLRFPPLERPLRTVAGADISYPRFGRAGVAGVIVFSYPSLEVREESFAHGELRFPYVPGLLSFREGPLLERALRKLKRKPDLVLFDGQGVAHPRGFGIASHLGLRLGQRAIGCAKTRLFGEEREPAGPKGSWTPLRGPEGAVVGAVLRSREGVKPIYVSPGHLIDLESSIRCVLSVTPRHRLPEPIRAAHRRTNEERRRRGIEP